MYIYMEEARSLTTSNLITFRGGPLKFQIASMKKAWEFEHFDATL